MEDVKIRVYKQGNLWLTEQPDPDRKVINRSTFSSKRKALNSILACYPRTDQLFVIIPNYETAPLS